ncbi:MAG: hypothetical protein GY761_19320 [Hyphomicrobiales bacterium]|nr:hypothetical protein [Hyphomicrobiales bacterium]
MISKNTVSDRLELSDGIELFGRWQRGDGDARTRLNEIFDHAIAGGYDDNFAIPPPQDRVNIGGSVNLLTLYAMHDIYGIKSDEFYKGDAKRYVRSTMVTRRLLGMNKLYISWPNYAFSSEAVGQSTMYPDKFPPGSDPDDMLINRENWQEIALTDFNTGIPKLLDEILEFYQQLTGMEPVLQLSAPYSLAADTFGQEPLLGCLVHDLDFANQLLDHLADQVITPWLNHFFDKFPKGWAEFSDASGSPFFIGPKNCTEIAIRSLRRIIDNNANTWGARVYDANYRGDYVALAEKSERKSRRRQPAGQNSNKVDLRELMDAKHTICRDFVIRLHDDRIPVSFYVDEAIKNNVPLFTGIGAGQIDRNSIEDIFATLVQVQSDVSAYVEAIKLVAQSISTAGYSRRIPPWPGTLYFEDVNFESDFGLIKLIVQEVTRNGLLNEI